MSLSYIDHQRTRFWRTHEEIFDFRKNRDKNWVELQAAQEQVRSVPLLAFQTPLRFPFPAFLLGSFA